MKLSFAASEQLFAFLNSQYQFFTFRANLYQEYTTTQITKKRTLINTKRNTGKYTAHYLYRNIHSGVIITQILLENTHPL